MSMGELASNRFCQLGARNIFHLANCTSSLVVDHIALVAKPPFEEVERLPLHADCVAVSLKKQKVCPRLTLDPLQRLLLRNGSA
jgi:hypothetical protein